MAALLKEFLVTLGNVIYFICSIGGIIGFIATH